MPDYIRVDKKLRKDVLEAKVVRGMFDVTDHYVVLAKIKLRDRWKYGKSDDNGRVSQVTAGERMDEKEV